MTNKLKNWPSWDNTVHLVASILLLIAILYTAIIWKFVPNGLSDWLNTLAATVISVLAALAIGLWVGKRTFQYQRSETERARREDLRNLLSMELNEIAKTMESYPSESHSSGAARTRLKKHYPTPLILQEAVKSGLFNTELNMKFQVLSRLMYGHQLEVRNAVNSLPLTVTESPETDRYELMVESVMGSEGRVIRGCREVIELLNSAKTS